MRQIQEFAFGVNEKLQSEKQQLENRIQTAQAELKEYEQNKYPAHDLYT